MMLYIVRHGQTEENQMRILQGHLPGKLTDIGKEQVRKAAVTLAEMHVEFRCIVSSDLKRAMDSAEIISEFTNLPVIPDPLLRERDWGKYTGMALSEAKDKYYHLGRWDFPDSAETTGEILARAKQALKELNDKYSEDNIIVVTHGQFARNLIAARFNCPYQEVTPFINAEIRTLKILI